MKMTENCHFFIFLNFIVHIWTEDEVRQSHFFVVVIEKMQGVEKLVKN